MWGQTLVRHPHVHCVVPAGGVAPDHQRWVHPTYAGFFLPVRVLSRVFRGKFVAGLRRAYACGELDLSGATAALRDPARWHAFVDALCRTDWVVLCETGLRRTRGTSVGIPIASRQQSSLGRVRWRASRAQPCQGRDAVEPS